MAVDVTVLAKGLQFPEGPVAMPDGSVLVAEIRGGCIRRVHRDGRVETVAETGGGPNGMAIGPDGALYVCNNGGNSYIPNQLSPTGPAKDYAGGMIQRVDLKTGEIKTLYSHCGENRLSSPNDIVFDAQGGFYFTDFGKKHSRHRDHGGIYYATSDGRQIVEVAYPVNAPNGIGLSADETLLYVAETETSRLWVYEIESPGTLRKSASHTPHGARLLCTVPGFQRLDSLAVDGDGNICVATLITGQITVISPDGQIARRVDLPDSYVTNLCFATDGSKTAYVTLSGKGELVSIVWPTQGQKLNFN